MTHIETAAENYAKYNYDKATDSYVVSKEAFKDGAQDMLERLCKYFESEHPTWYEHLGDEFRKSMEE